jgi:hypothetical protein
MKKTVHFKYTNGRGWKATNVTEINYSRFDQEIEYTRHNKSTGIQETFKLPAKDVAYYSINSSAGFRTVNVHSRARVRVG